MTVYAGGVLGELQKLSRFFPGKAFILHSCRKGTGLEYCSHSWRNCLYSWIKPHPPEEQSCIRLLQDKSLSQGQPSFLTQWVTFENASSTTMQTLSLDVDGWRGLRKRSHMGNCLPWVFTAIVQDEAGGAARFCPTVWSLWPASVVASNTELFHPANWNLYYPAAALCFWFSNTGPVWKLHLKHTQVVVCSAGTDSGKQRTQISFPYSLCLHPERLSPIKAHGWGAA